MKLSPFYTTNVYYYGISIMFVLSWVLAPCGFVGRCQRLGETCCLHLQGWSDKAGKWVAYIGSEKRRPREGSQSERRNMSSFLESYISLYFPALWLQPWIWRQHVSQKRWHRPTKLHGAKTQDNNNNTLCRRVNEMYLTKENLTEQNERINIDILKMYFIY
jgi:hypothetical protein